MDKYYVSFSWYKDHYCTELSTRRNFYVKASSNEDAVHIAHERCDIDTNANTSRRGINYNINTIRYYMFRKV